MKLTLRDGDRQAVIDDPSTSYSTETLTSWAATAASLMTTPDQVPTPQGATAQVELAAQFDHDQRSPVGFGRPTRQGAQDRSA